jgi:hypothetical protein
MVKITIGDRIDILDEQTNHRIARIVQYIKLGSYGSLLKKIGIVHLVIAAIGYPVFKQYYEAKLKKKTNFDDKLGITITVALGIINILITMYGYHYLVTKILQLRYQYFTQASKDTEQLTLKVNLLSKNTFTVLTREHVKYYIHRQGPFDFTILDAGKIVLFDTKSHLGLTRESMDAIYDGDILRRAELIIQTPETLSVPKEVLYIAIVVVYLKGTYRPNYFIALLKLLGVGLVSVATFLLHYMAVTHSFLSVFEEKIKKVIPPNPHVEKLGPQRQETGGSHNDPHKEEFGHQQKGWGGHGHRERRESHNDPHKEEFGHQQTGWGRHGFRERRESQEGRESSSSTSEDPPGHRGPEEWRGSRYSTSEDPLGGFGHRRPEEWRGSRYSTSEDPLGGFGHRRPEDWGGTHSSAYLGPHHR